MDAPNCRSSPRRSWRALRCERSWWAPKEYRGLVSEPVRVVLGEDDVLLREGIARLLADAGFEVVSQAGDAEAFLRKSLAHRPDVAVVDIQMPPGRGDDGLQAA